MFVLPKANSDAATHLEAVLRLVKSPLRARVEVVHVETLLDSLAGNQTPGGLGWYAALLQEKYVAR